MIQIQDINPRLIEAEYAVRGSIVLRAQELQRQGKIITYCNIGNPHTFAQKPLTYVREVLSLLEYPQLITEAHKLSIFKSDSIERAKKIMATIPEGLGAYSATTGIEFVRKAIAEFIQKRDGIAADYTRIILTDGASEAAQTVITAIIKSTKDGIMVPIPQYPLYNASLMLKGGSSIGYYLDEANNWQLNADSLEDSIRKAKQQGVKPVAITIINPGNPTGGVLSHENIKMVINFARKHKLSIMADEVYQENIYNKEHKFYSFAKVLDEMQVTDISLFSFHSMSKGYFGECGHRSAYCEVRNVPDDVFDQIIKLQSINLCANVVGQIATYLMVTPPQLGDPSYPLFLAEKTAILDDLEEKATIIGEELNKIPGISVNLPDGAMYAFVKLELPTHLIDTHNGMIPLDEEYCLDLLEATGICVVPGSGFGQLPNTLHFRTTFLPPKEQILTLVSKLKEFHISYIERK